MSAAEIKILSVALESVEARCLPAKDCDTDVVSAELPKYLLLRLVQEEVRVI